MSKTSEEYRSVTLSDGRVVVVDLTQITRRKTLQLIFDKSRMLNIGARIDELAMNTEISTEEFEAKLQVLEKDFMSYQEKISREQAPIFGMKYNELVDLPDHDYNLLLAKVQELQNNPAGGDPS